MLDFTDIKNISRDIIDNVEKVIIGKKEQIIFILISIFSSGHVLLEDVPGVGKTMLARSISMSLGCSFKRIQFTPDLLPSDITGVSIYNQKTNAFEFHPGPVVSQLVLADEINRGSPKTQSSLLEAMEEKQITVDGVTRKLPAPFIVIATQNSIEFDGTYALPRAQLDRFFMRIHLGYPDQAAEEELLLRQQKKHPVLDLKSIINSEKLIDIQNMVKEVFISDKLRTYIVNIVQKTRNNEFLDSGVSPRGGITIFKAAQALAAIEGRDYATPDDIKKVVFCSLSHRLFSGFDHIISEEKINKILSDILNRLTVPTV